MTVLYPYVYLANQSLAASFNGPPIDVSLLKDVSFTVNWGADANNDGDWHIEVSDDPRVEEDKQRGTSTARWSRRTIPTGSYDGTNITVTGQNITIGTDAGDFNLALEALPAYMRLAFTQRGVGVTTTARATVSGT